MLKHRPEALRLLDQDGLRTGNVDSWLLWNLTAGATIATDWPE